jgi:hypothetical protein
MFFMQYTIKAEWEQEDGSVIVAELGTIEGEACQSASDVGLKLADVKPLLTRLQEVVVREQLRNYCHQSRRCSCCQRQRNVKDYRQRRLDTVLGQITVQAPRFEGCPVCDQKHVFSPISRLLPQRVLPELHHLQARLATELPYRQATALLRELLPSTGGLTPVTTRQRTLAVGQRMEQELCHESQKRCSVAEPAEHLSIGIDGAFERARRSVANQRHHFEVLTGRVERKRGRGQAFAVVRDRRAKHKVQAILRRCGRGLMT